MPRPSDRPDSRARLLAAAADEFAARGFVGANVDRIARRARVNKAMIYYHFASKLGLYREILRDMFRATGDRVAGVAAAGGPPVGKVRAFVAALVAEAERRPHFPPIMLRELAEKGTHLDPDTLRLMSRVPRALHAIIAEGAATGAFRPVPPFLVYLTIIGPLMFYFASAPVRERLARLGALDLDAITREAVVAHIQRVALSRLSPAVAGEPELAGRPS